MDIHNSRELQKLIEKCRKNDRKAQQQLFQATYSYAMSVCLRFSGGREEAGEILNDGYLKVFTQLDKYNPELSFGGWLRRIMVNTAIDHYRKNQRHAGNYDLEVAAGVTGYEDFMAELDAEDLLRLVQNLPNAYRMAFTLYAIEGYSHPEIAKKLGISEGTSKSNLARARAKLQQQIKELHETPFSGL